MIRKMKNLFRNILTVATVATLISGCSLAGLDLQENYDRVPHTVDPKIYKSTWQYLKDRSRGANSEARIFDRMMEAIEYSGIDTNEYKKPNRTFILLNNGAVTGTNFWGTYKINNKVATKWDDYPKEFVKNYLLYLIVEGQHDHFTIPALQTVEGNTLAPKGYWNQLPVGITSTSVFLPNPNSIMTIKVLNSSPSNTSDYPIVLNEVLNARTSSIQATNGSIHVIGGVLTTSIPE